jgi:hypothetical protein
MYITKLIIGTYNLLVLVLVLASILIALNIATLYASYKTAMLKDIALVAKLLETIARYYNYLLDYRTKNRGNTLYFLNSSTRKGKSI